MSKPTKKPPAKGLVLRLHRESDDHGDFFVAFLIRPEAPTDFLTFGSRDLKTARDLALAFARSRKLKISRTITTDENDDEET